MGVSGRRTAFRDAFAPWAGLALGWIGGAFAQQAGSQGVFNRCSSSPALVLAVCLIGIAIIAAGAFESWRVFRSGTEAPARRLIASVSLGTAAFVIFAIFLPILAALVIPACAA